MRNQRRMFEAKEKAELLGRANGELAHVLRIFDEEAQAMQSVRNLSRMLQESFVNGTAILSKYAVERECLKRAQRKALDRCRIFLKVQLPWNVIILADHLDAKGLMLQKAIVARLFDEFACKKATKDLEYFIAVTTLESIGEGRVRQNTV
ncbi:hypothetical protein CRYUN_Cryun05aG0113000 [Craigia yunnanensis]